MRGQCRGQQVNVNVADTRGHQLAAFGQLQHFFRFGDVNEGEFGEPGQPLGPLPKIAQSDLAKHERVHHHITMAQKLRQ